MFRALQDITKIFNILTQDNIEVVLDSSGWSHMDSGYKCLGSITQCVGFLMPSMRIMRFCFC
jgi:hypothetical protein